MVVVSIHFSPNYGLGLNNTISFHNTHGFSVLSHNMQFHSHNNHTDRLEREAHQRLVSAPRYTYTTALLTQGKTCGMPHNLHTFAVNGKAAQYRFACFTSKLFGRYHQ